MPYKDKEKQKAYQREWQRQKRAGAMSNCRTLNPEELKTAEAMLDALADILAEVLSAKADLFMRARTAGYLISIGIKAVETAELERRLTELENRLGGKGK